MSTSGLDAMADRMLKRVNKDLRKQVQAHPGQIFIWRRGEFEEAMAKHTTPANVKRLSTYFHNLLTAADQRQMSIKARKAKLLATKREIIAKKLDNFNIKEDELFAVNNYYSVQRIKTDVGDFFNKITNKDRSLVTGQGNKQGFHIGHGEYSAFGLGRAVSTTQALAAEAVLNAPSSEKFANDPAFKRLEAHITKYKEDMELSLDVKHYQEVTVRGTLKKIYTPILSSQEAIKNIEDAGNEKALLAILRKSIEDEIANIANAEGSRSLKEAITDTTIQSLLGTEKYLKHTGPGKPTKSAKSKSKGNSKKNLKRTKQANIISGAGATLPATERARKGVSGMPLHLIGVLNEQLPRTVAKNMKAPRLENRTGRFAGSVQVTDIIPTGKGYPSIGYTYQRSPYETFEPGNAQGSVPRDPRRLIDASIREIAAQYAIGRFYTRRV